MNCGTLWAHGHIFTFENENNTGRSKGKYLLQQCNPLHLYLSLTCYFRHSYWNILITPALPPSLPLLLPSSSSSPTAHNRSSYFMLKQRNHQSLELSRASMLRRLPCLWFSLWIPINLFHLRHRQRVHFSGLGETHSHPRENLNLSSSKNVGKLPVNQKWPLFPMQFDIFITGYVEWEKSQLSTFVSYVWKRTSVKDGLTSHFLSTCNSLLIHEMSPLYLNRQSFKCWAQ